MQTVTIKTKLQCDGCSALIEERDSIHIDREKQDSGTTGLIDKHYKLEVMDGYDGKNVYLCDQCHDKLPKVLQEHCVKLEKDDNNY